jgi:regulator of PEP synthase PpsR (kinase-PPPase family)
MVYTLVEPGYRDSMRQLCRRARVRYCDLQGHRISTLSGVAGEAARKEPGARAPLDQTYFKRIEAIEFAVRYDDGVGGGLDEADIVLVGVSRTSKTPLSIFLGYLGHKAANVPIVKGVDPPPALFEIDRAKIVGLTIDAERLADIREERVRSMGAPRRRYADLEAVFEELEAASRVHRRLRCPVIDVSELSVEETAMRIVRLVAERARRREGVRA